MFARIICSLLVLVIVTLPVAADVDLGGKKISLELDAIPLADALSMIAAQNNLNLVISDDIKGVATIRLENVDIATALDAILSANGYNYFLKDDVIVVKSVETYASGEMETRVFTLKYANPATALKALNTRKSEKGQVVVLDHRAAEADGGAPSSDNYYANRILVTDYPRVLTELAALVDLIDIRERTVLIEVKVIETTIDNKTNFGFSWPTSVSAKLSGADDGTSSGTSTVQSGTGTNNAGVYSPPGSGRWVWGKLSVAEVGVVLNALEQSGNGRLVSDPRVMTLENHEAIFKFETIIPIQTINRFTEGAATSDIVTFEDEEVGISLRVTPRINENGRITLDVNPQVEDIIGYSGPPDNQKPITSSRSIQTTITVDAGETIALGGLLKESEIETISRVPVLGYIPILGKLLFTSKKTEKISTDLMIFITPHIID